MKFNINDIVKVRLTDVGRQELRRQHDELYGQICIDREYIAPKENGSGMVEFQLWDLMSRLGHLCQLGFQPPFDTHIEINAAPDRTADKGCSVEGIVAPPPPVLLFRGWVKDDLSNFAIEIEKWSDGKTCVINETSDYRTVNAEVGGPTVKGGSPE